VRINRVDYLYNSFNNIVEINRTLYDIQWEDEYLLIIDENKSRIDIPLSAGELAELVITTYLACLAKEGKIE